MWYWFVWRLVWCFTGLVMCKLMTIMRIINLHIQLKHDNCDKTSMWMSDTRMIKAHTFYMNWYRVVFVAYFVGLLNFTNTIQYR